ncbi:GNAT family N-acetyltransferase [Conyzicola nivalis]|uniref:N-acetyltransferase n=1 Tax=Conyzicola nivalis TaxID=1477021 RepID=A0A916SRE0_9MICO|nr:GNAT family N-acetyltransferase [Conyzicola nivalis]GGB09612.1 N-acetyltransferase [Conyzicola nivalis]
MPLPWTPVLPISTPRLLLRAHTADDLDDLLQFHSDPEVVRYLPWPVRSIDETRFALLAKVPQARVDSEGQWLVLAVELAETGQVIGEVVLKCVSETEGEIGFALHAGFQRAGYGYEAASTMLSLAFGELALTRVTATLDARNAASAALLEKLGMTRGELVRDRPFKGGLVDELHYAIDVTDHL